RLQAGGRNAHCQGRAQLAVPHDGGDGARMARARALPPRGVFHAGRHRTPARAFRHRALRLVVAPCRRLRRLNMNAIAKILETMDYGISPEDSGIVNAWLERHSGGFGHFIAGEFTKPGKTFDVMNPATDKTIAKVTQGTAADVDAAVKAARAALPKWSALPWPE